MSQVYWQKARLEVEILPDCVLEAPTWRRRSSQAISSASLQLASSLACTLLGDRPGGSTVQWIGEMFH